MNRLWVTVGVGGGRRGGDERGREEERREGEEGR